MNERAMAKVLTCQPGTKGTVFSVTGPHDNRLVTAFAATPERQG